MNLKYKYNKYNKYNLLTGGVNIIDYFKLDELFENYKEKTIKFQKNLYEIDIYNNEYVNLLYYIENKYNKMKINNNNDLLIGINNKLNLNNLDNNIYKNQEYIDMINALNIFIERIKNINSVNDLNNNNYTHNLYCSIIKYDKNKLNITDYYNIFNDIIDNKILNSKYNLKNNEHIHIIITNINDNLEYFYHYIFVINNMKAILINKNIYYNNYDNFIYYDNFIKNKMNINNNIIINKLLFNNFKIVHLYDNKLISFIHKFINKFNN